MNYFNCSQRHQKPVEFQTETNLDRLLAIRNRQGRFPLYCIHPSGGDIGIYRKMATRISADFSVWGIQSRLLCGAKTEMASLEEMAVEYCRLINAHQPTGNLRLLGFSLGGFLASLMAREFEKSSRVVSFLGLIDSNPAWIGDSKTSRHELCVRLKQVFTKFQSVGVLKPKPTDTVERDVANLVDACLGSRHISPEEVMSKTAALGYFPSHQRESEMLLKFTDAFLSHCRLMECFVAPKVECPLRVWWPSESKLENEAGSTIWAKKSQTDFAESCIEGDHYSIMRGASVRELAKQVEAAIREADSLASWKLNHSAPKLCGCSIDSNC
jgi:thioesterase domain-containing protein